MRIQKRYLVILGLAVLFGVGGFAWMGIEGGLQSATFQDTNFFKMLNSVITSKIATWKLAVATTTADSVLNIAGGVRTYKTSSSTCTAANDGEIYYNADTNNWVGCSNKVLKVIKNGN